MYTINKFTVYCLRFGHLYNQCHLYEEIWVDVLAFFEWNRDDWVHQNIEEIIKMRIHMIISVIVHCIGDKWGILKSHICYLSLTSLCYLLTRF